MKITRSALKNLIKEEMRRINEDDPVAVGGQVATGDGPEAMESGQMINTEDWRTWSEKWLGTVSIGCPAWGTVMNQRKLATPPVYPEDDAGKAEVAKTIGVATVTAVEEHIWAPIDATMAKFGKREIRQAEAIASIHAIIGDATTGCPIAASKKEGNKLIHFFDMATAREEWNGYLTPA